MAGFLFKLERADGTPAERSSLSSAVPNCGPGETIHFGRKMLRVVAVRDNDADSPHGWDCGCVALSASEQNR